MKSRATLRDILLGFYEMLIPARWKKNRMARKIFAWTTFFLVAVALMGFGRIGITSPLGKITLCLGTILLGTEIAFFLMHFCDRGWIRNVFFCLVFTLGLAAYFELVPSKGDPWEVLLAGCKSLGCFFPSRGEYDTYCGKDVCAPAYILFQILVYVFFAYFALYFWGARVYNRVLNFWTRDKNKCVFWCDTISEKMLLLSGNIMDNEGGWRIVFSISEEKNQGKDYFLFREMNYLDYVLKLRKPRQVHSDCLKAEKHFFLTDDFNWNIRKAQALLEVRAKNKIASPADLYIMTSDSGEENGYYLNWADHIQAKSAVVPEKYGQVEVHLVNESELIARKFIETYPMLKSPGIVVDPKTATVRGKFKVLLLGLGDQGEALLRNMIEDGQFVHSPRGSEVNPDFKVDIFDKKPGSLGYFFKKHPDANRYCRMPLDHLENYQIDVFSEEFHDFLTAHVADYNRIVICLGDDRTNVRAAACLERVAKLQNCSLKGKLFVVLEQNNALFDELKNHDAAIAECLEKSKAAGKLQMTVIGSPREIFTYDNIAGNDEIVKMGKLVNLTWLLKESEPLETLLEGFNGALKWFAARNDDNKSGVPAAKIVPYFNRQSSIACAKGFRNIILLLDPDLSAAEAARAVPEREVQGELLETIAETEHMRWNAFHFMHGVKCWRLEEVTDEGAAGHRPNDIRGHGRHAALVPYAELGRVNECFGLTDKDSMEETDRKIVEILLKVRSAMSRLYS